MSLYGRLRPKISVLFSYLRLNDLKWGGAVVANDVKAFGRFVWIGNGGNIKIGSGSTINEGVFLNARDKIIIGKNVHLSPYVQLHTGGLVTDSLDRRHVKAPIIIEDSVWVASGVVVTKGVRIGQNSVIGANSVVTKDVPPNTLVAGVPAEFIRHLSMHSKVDI